MNNLITKICPQCKTEFPVPPKRKKVFCGKPCYYKFNNKKLKEAYRQKRRILKENPIYPKYIDDNGVEYQLDFDPVKDHNRFDRFKLNLKQKNTD